MNTRILHEIDFHQQNQRKRILYIVVWIILITATILGFLNIRYETWTSVFALFGLALLCIPIIILNSRGHYSIAGILLSALVLIVIVLNLYDGDGILDPGILAMPMFILFGALILGKRFAPFFLVASILSMYLIVDLEIKGQIHPTIHAAKYSDLYPILILLSVTSLMVWVIVNNYENNLERVKDSNIELSLNYDLTIEAMANVLEFRDLETAGHSSRVVDLSEQLARLLGIPEQEIEHLRRGALLHDIGKLAIPDSILLKPGKLNEEETEIMQKHPEYGREMLTGITFLNPVIPVVYSHHERWDGKGYPEGLIGEQIPLFARIFTIVDHWDALNSDRPYRKSWPQEKVVKYVQENAGIAFDPNIAQLFLDLLSS